MKKKIMTCAMAFVMALTGTTYIAHAESTAEPVILNDETGIPDKEFYQQILQYYDKNNDNVLQASEAEQVTEISFREGVKDITGVSCFKNLETLWIYNIAITDAQLDEIGKIITLQSLFMYNTGIDDISDISNLINLESLLLEDNNISDIEPLSGLTGLRVLRLGRNKIVDISPLASLVNLKNLSVEGNRIKDISVINNLTKLSELDMDYNEIKDISPALDLKELEILSAVNNKIESFSGEAQLESLKELYLTNNKITDISAIKYCENLEYVYLDENSITDISPLSGTGTYEALDLSDNKIQTIPDEFVVPATTSMFYPADACVVMPGPRFDLRGNMITKAEARRKFSEELLSETMNDSTYTWFQWQDFVDDIAGDLNGDMNVSLEDTVILLNAALGINKLEEYEIAIADINMDGEVTLSDCRLLLSMALGIK